MTQPDTLRSKVQELRNDLSSGSRSWHDVIKRLDDILAVPDEKNVQEPASFMPLANLVAQKGIKFFVEPQSNRSMAGMDAAARLQLTGYACESDTEYAAEIARRFPDFEIYDGDAMTFLREIIPKLWEPTFFWLDPSSPTHAEELALIEAASEKQSWFMDFKKMKHEDQMDYSLGN